jgi:hypothetical protein
MAKNPMSRLIEQLRSVALLDKRAALTDAQLLDGFVSRCDGEAIDMLVRRHSAMVWGVCRRVLSDHHDAEDAFQAAFLVFVRKRRRSLTRPKSVTGCTVSHSRLLSKPRGCEPGGTSVNGM